MKYDVFISHASEDKAEFVEPLVAALEGLGLDVWYDRQQIKLGDDFTQKINEGLVESRFGVVVLSPSYGKYWPELELGALFQQAWAFGVKKVLPIFHGLSAREVTARWPLVAGKSAAYSSEGPSRIAEQILEVVKDASGP